MMSARRTGTFSLVTVLNRVLLTVIILMLLAGAYWRQPGAFQKPATCRIGSVDARFGLTRQEVAHAVEQAAAVWENAAGRDLFRTEETGAIEINLVYDYRQEASEKLRNIGGSIDSSKGSYETLKIHIERLESEYEQQKAEYASEVESYNARVQAYNTVNSSVPRSATLPDDVRTRLLDEKQALDVMRLDLRRRQEDMKATADTINSMVAVINEMAANLNLEVMRYNTTGKDLGREFSEGYYERKNGTETITVFHFNDRKRLVRVLAHEMGHALGLKHNDNPQALMFRINQSDSLELAPDDVKALMSVMEKR